MSLPNTPGETPLRQSNSAPSTPLPSNRPHPNNVYRPKDADPTNYPPSAEVQDRDRTSDDNGNDNSFRIQSQQKLVCSKIQQLDKSLWLKENNYQTWKFYMESIMQSERTWVVTHDRKASEIVSAHHEQMINGQSTTLMGEMAVRAANTIKMNLDPSQVPLIMACKSAFEMWNTLKARHEIQCIYRSGILRIELQRDSSC